MTIIPIVTKSKNSQAWSGEQCIQSFLDDIRSGTIEPTKLMILWFSTTADGGMTPHRWFAQIDRSEEIALLELAKYLAIDDWTR